MTKKGITLIELVMVLVVLGITVGVFFGLINGMIDSGLEIMGGKESYQQANLAMEKIASDLQLALRAGTNHNFGVVSGAPWQNVVYYSRTYFVSGQEQNTRFAYFPDPSTPSKYYVYRWMTPSPSIGSCGYCFVRQEWSGTTLVDTLVYAGPGNTTTDYLMVRYFDDDASDGTSVGEIKDSSSYIILDHVDAVRIGHIELALTVANRGKPVTIFKSIFLRERPPVPQEGT
ncbi:MAG: type II secretion system protein [Candidatus Omnitrophota bacterium]